LRTFTRARAPRRRQKRIAAATFRSRRLTPPSSEGRWTLVPGGTDPVLSRATRPRIADTTAWVAAVAQQLLTRHGVLTRESLEIEQIPGAFGIVYPVLRQLEEGGRIRRGYFVAGLGAAQFALPGAVDLLRSLRDAPDETDVILLAATDPANPYGATLKWPLVDSVAGRRASRTVGASVVLVNGALAAYLARGDRQLLAFLPESEPDRSKVGRAI